MANHDPEVVALTPPSRNGQPSCGDVIGTTPMVRFRTWPLRRIRCLLSRNLPRGVDHDSVPGLLPLSFMFGLKILAPCRAAWIRSCVKGRRVDRRRRSPPSAVERTGFASGRVRVAAPPAPPEETTLTGYQEDENCPNCDGSSFSEFEMKSMLLPNASESSNGRRNSFSASLRCMGRSR